MPAKKPTKITNSKRKNQEAAWQTLKRIKIEEKKKKEKQYQNEIKDVLSGFLVTSEKAPEAVASQPAKAVKPTTSKTATVSLTDDLKKIRQTILEFLDHGDQKEEPAARPKFEFKKPPEKEPAAKKPAPLAPKFKIGKIEKEQPSKKEELKIKRIIDKAFVPKDSPVEKLNKKPFLRTIIFLIIFLLIIVSVGIYLGGWQGSLATALTKVIPYPVLYVEGSFVKASYFFEDVEALRRYFNRLGLPVEEVQLKRQVMSSLIERQVIAKIAARQGLSVTDEETGQLLGQLMTEEADLEQLINDLYGWDTKEYVDRVLKPLLLAQKAENDYYQSDFMKAVNDEMAGYQAEVEADPAKFSEIASRVNDDSTKFVEGDLGWFSLGDMVPELELALLDLVEGQISPVVETRFGLHLILLQERIINEGGETTFHASHIFKQTPAFSDYLDEAIKKATVVTLIKI